MKKKTKKRLPKTAKRIIALFLIVVLSGGGYVLGVNFYVILSQKKNIISLEEASHMDKVDYVLVLGCGVREDGEPSHMLYERLKRGAEVLEKVNGAKLLLTGDNSGESYNELAAMKRVSLENGVKEEKMVIDDFGFSTYESLYNAKNNFSAKKIIIITQPYHMYRALYIANKLGIEAYGVTAYLPFYPMQIIWSLREVLARNKDFLLCMFSR
ncbi:MAG: YdcF family protein [Clostridia bacterium]|nr:YdcF family protein [Clostridia bacterium]